MKMSEMARKTSYDDASYMIYTNIYVISTALDGIPMASISANIFVAFSGKLEFTVKSPSFVFSTPVNIICSPILCSFSTVSSSKALANSYRQT